MTTASKSPASRKPSAARVLAWTCIRDVRVRQAYAHDVLKSALDHTTLSAEDAAFVRVLVLGVVSTSGTLDELINRVLRSPKDVEADVRDCLRLSTYELFFLHKAAHAAVDQGVSLVRHVRPRAAGVGNYCLRRLAELVEAFPFGDAGTDIEACARQQGFPFWLATMLDGERGFAWTEAFMQASNAPAPVFLGVNTLLISEDEVRNRLLAASISFDDGKAGEFPVPGCFLLKESTALGREPVAGMISRGELIVADASAQAVATLAAGDTAAARVLEIGAGRGTKSILMQSQACRLTGTQLRLTALDCYQWKLDLLERRMQQAGCACERLICADATHLDDVLPGESFDRVLVDAPCSGLGTLRRHPEIRWRLQPDDVVGLSQTGLGMLESAAGYVRSGGVITYATCTITRAETTDVIAAFLDSAVGSAFEQVAIAGSSAFACALTPAGADAHFAVQLRRVR